ncbi:DUF4180 domain-containing protein [Pedobacter sp. ISL-68]|uniref:DUF4180 domain-containing protein n=1 Tax=unclassified Pedobacter TaxID=2628915 RepID=UPI001BE52689|nr:MULTISPECIES: DUF4180 domain-containing protein [unclassified Pedobacter]MBT2559940.1 DUF4180 domain-containing protein [Pedobacter sp. ISL-64]MBT2592245.1 DUF4180 domain-containing protein [Pedobacter sp. ISL-68]
MKIESHTVNNTNIAEILSEEIIINNAADGLDLLGNLYYQDFDKIIIHAQNITPAFFDLKNGIAGEILQKFSNYRVSLAIIGDFSPYQNKSIKDFIYESNKGKHINFLGSTAEALTKLAG